MRNGIGKGVRAAATGALAALAGALGAGAAAAQTIGELGRARDARYAAELRAVNEEAAAAFERAEAAYDASNYADAAPLYARASELAPAFVPARRRHVLALSDAGRHDEALGAARAWHARDPSSEDGEGALALALAEHPASGKAELDEAVGYAVAAAERRPDDPRAQQVLCATALRASRATELRACSQALMQRWPTSPEGFMFGTIAAAAGGDEARARELLAGAKSRGAPAEQLAALGRALDESQPAYARWGRRLWPVLVAWAGALALLIAAGAALSRAALRAAGAVPREASGRARGADAFLRAAYRVVLAASGVFYYASLPLVAAAVVAAAGAVVVGLLALGVVPVKLVIIAGAVALVTLYAFAKSLFACGADGEPGVRLDLADEPALRAALDEVATKVGTRSVDAVYLTPGAEVAVFERGGLGRQLAGRAERCLVLGVGVLEGLSLAPFKAIVAHEYGHFSNRDTAGGGLALAVRRSLLRAAVGLARGGAAGWYNPAWWFVSGYYRVFLRISHGASRLQEVLADRWAAFTYGPEAFAEGLTHVVRRAVAFDEHARATLREVIEERRPLANLYRHCPRKAPAGADLESKVRAAFEREPSPFDSHPSPAERIAWVRTLKAPPPAKEAGEAWGLFRDRDAIELLLTEHVRENVARAHGVKIPTGRPPGRREPGEPGGVLPIEAKREETARVEGEAFVDQVDAPRQLAGERPGPSGAPPAGR
jgi:Zn-dependent protease with chaperone function